MDRHRQSAGRDLGWLGSLKITGKSTWSIEGDFDADLILTGANAPTSKVLRSASIKDDVTGSLWRLAGDAGNISIGGELRDAQIRASGSLGALTMGAAYGSDVLAGVAGGAARHPADDSQFLNPLAMIKSVKIKGWRVPRGTPAPRFMEDSNFSGPRIGTVSIRNGDFAVGDSGIYVMADILNPLRVVRHTDSVDRDNNWIWKPTLTDQAPDDYIHLL